MIAKKRYFKFMAQKVTLTFSAKKRTFKFYGWSKPSAG